MRSENMRRIRRRGLAIAVSLVGFCALCASAGVEVLTSSDTATWNRMYSSSVTLTWDWSWEWVPAEAASVRVSVVGARHKTVLDQVFAKGGATSVALDVGTVTAENEDVYTATLTFLDEGGAELATRSADLYALGGSFGAARVCTQAANHPDWRNVKGPALIPYDAAWSDETAAATAGTLTVTPTGKAAFDVPFGRRSGVLAVKGRNETVLSLSFDAEGADPLEASLVWDVPGMMLFLR